MDWITGWEGATFDMLYEAFLIGLIIAFIYYEVTGLTPGGVIAPAYLALYVNEPTKIVTTLGVAIIVWGILELLRSFLFIYGRRQLLLALLLGFAVGTLVNRFFGGGSYWPPDLHSIGHLVPGLVANEMVRQKILPTLTSLALVLAFTYLILVLVN
ncbi:MAG: poly-gamma-glutamate biosynthesis protein PgsC [Candidatus Neomarinimicrobiota bacterium]